MSCSQHAYVHLTILQGGMLYTYTHTCHVMYTPCICTYHHMTGSMLYRYTTYISCHISLMHMYIPPYDWEYVIQVHHIHLMSHIPHAYTTHPNHTTGGLLYTYTHIHVMSCEPHAYVHTKILQGGMLYTYTTYISCHVHHMHMYISPYDRGYVIHVHHIHVMSCTPHAYIAPYYRGYVIHVHHIHAMSCTPHALHTQHHLTLLAVVTYDKYFFTSCWLVS